MHKRGQKWSIAPCVGVVVALVKALAHSRLDAAERGREPQEVEHVLDKKGRCKVRADLNSLWADLPYVARLELLEDPGEELCAWNCFDLGDDPIQPTWLAEHGQELGSVPQRGTEREGMILSSVEELGERIRRCNDLARRSGLDRFFSPGDRFPELVRLARPARTEVALRDVVRLLHQTLVEGTPANPLKTVSDGRKDAYAALYGARGKRALDVLRNFEFHDVGLRRDEAATRKLHEKQGSVFAGYLDGKKLPSTPEEYERVHASLVEDLNDALRAAQDALERAAS